MHWNIQINIQSVEEPRPIEVSSYQSRPANSLPPMTERKINKVLEMAIVADSEEEAYAKAHRMLNANAPGNVSPWEQLTRQHLHRASCDDSGGNRVCGYPADGPTI